MWISDLVMLYNQSSVWLRPMLNLAGHFIVLFCNNPNHINLCKYISIIIIMSSIYRYIYVKYRVSFSNVYPMKSYFLHARTYLYDWVSMNTKPAKHIRLYSTRGCLCFLCAIKPNASEMYICNANDSTYIPLGFSIKMRGIWGPVLWICKYLWRKWYLYL